MGGGAFCGRTLGGTGTRTGRRFGLDASGKSGSNFAPGRDGDTGAGTGEAIGVEIGVGSDVGTGVEPWAGTGVAIGAEIGARSDVGTGVDPCAGTNVGTGTGTEDGIRREPGIGAGRGKADNTGPCAVFASNPGVGTSSFIEASQES